MFQRMFRMSRNTFNRVLHMVAPHLPQGTSSNGMSITPEERLLVFLHWAGSGTTNLHGSYAHDMGEGTVYNCIDSVIEALYEHVAPEQIVLPTEEQARREADLFHAKSRFPRLIWGAIDGTHVDVSQNIRGLKRVILSRISFLLTFFHMQTIFCYKRLGLFPILSILFFKLLNNPFI